MENKKRIIALGLAGALILSLASCGSTDGSKSSQASSGKESSVASESSAAAQSTETSVESNYPEWINTESDLPIVKEGTEKTLSIYYKQIYAGGPEPEEHWVAQFIENAMNINVELTPFTADSRDEVLSLAFAGNELPDIILDANFSTSELMTYGASEGQLIDLAPYINETYMPNLTSVYEQYPEAKQQITDSEGHIWSLGLIANSDYYDCVERFFINYDWLEECGLEIPTTLEDFIDVMRIFKEKGYAEYPIGGSVKSANPARYILNAIGYLGANANANNICLRDGDVVALPMADRERFGEFLKIMNQLYTEGLIHPDFYTMDAATTNAVLAEGAGLICQAPFVYTTSYAEYWAATPLTSEWKDTPNAALTPKATLGKVVVTSSCEDIELALKFIDFMYDPEPNEGGTYNYDLMFNGPITEYDVENWGYGQELVALEDGSLKFKSYIDNTANYSSYNEFANQQIQVWNNGVIGFDGDSYIDAEIINDKDYTVYDDCSQFRHTELADNQEYCWRVAIQEIVYPLGEDKYPSYVFFDVETTNELTDCLTSMKEYATQEIAKFVTGARPLTDEELSDYFDTLDSLGAQEYVKAYADYYESYKQQ